MPDIISYKVRAYIKKHRPEVMPGRLLICKGHTYRIIPCGGALFPEECADSCKAAIYMNEWLTNELTPHKLIMFGPMPLSPDWLVRIGGCDFKRSGRLDALFDAFKAVTKKGKR